ncbi:uncharacterized protein V1518DRAFT_408017 [Limtongia smithiae]|uniref:uncharacterized protein n=1 Tax=Limtongia smithiae TaxID=1125753 RepID=UPI0034CE7438
MVLEATMVVMDNSEYMRNGDFTPSRFDSQSDAVNLIFTAKTNSNPENAVGLMTMAARAPEVLVTLTSDFGKILAASVRAKVEGQAHLTTAIQIAALALKHRQNKSQRQRIIVFVGSPIAEDEKELVKLAKKMKKNNVAVDFINFGQDAENVDKLDKFIRNVKSGENSHLVTIPAGPHLLSDIIVTSPILTDEDGVPQVSAATAARYGGSSGNPEDVYEFGVDPNLDPELALALRISLEEERARQAQRERDAVVPATIPEETTTAPAGSSAVESALAGDSGVAPPADDGAAPAPKEDKMDTDD